MCCPLWALVALACALLWADVHLPSLCPLHLPSIIDPP